MKLIPTIGIEMHCEMKSFTKVFSPARNTYSKHANNHVSEIDIALPGILPSLNKECIRKSILMASILHCKLPQYIYFDRKNYYYPDLPKGYQITQSHEPIGVNGYIDVPYNDGVLRVDIHDIHLEEDTAKIEHLDTESLINYNRAGVPLLELVTDPVFHSKEEVIAFLEYIRSIYQYTDISEADIRKGQIRCDVNISVGEEGGPFGTRVEIKGVDSFSNIQKVIDIEVKRQMDLINDGKSSSIEQETRRFDEANNRTIRMRGKVDAIDYKYFVEPNIPKIKLDEELVKEITSNIVELPLSRMTRYKDLGINDDVVKVLVRDRKISDYYDEVLKCSVDPIVLSNYVATNIMGYLSKKNIVIDEFKIEPKDLGLLLNKLQKKEISSKQTKEIFEATLNGDTTILKELDNTATQNSNTEELDGIVSNIIKNSPKQVEDYKNGRTNLFNYFVGQVMKETKGSANPEIVKDIISKYLKN